MRDSFHLTGAGRGQEIRDRGIRRAFPEALPLIRYRLSISVTVASSSEHFDKQTFSTI